jgi:hypothetical protein
MCVRLSSGHRVYVVRKKDYVCLYQFTTYKQLQSIVKHILFESRFPKFPEMIKSGKFTVFPKSREFPENPRKIPGKPRGKIRGFFVFYGCNRL